MEFDYDAEIECRLLQSKKERRLDQDSIASSRPWLIIPVVAWFLMIGCSLIRFELDLPKNHRANPRPRIRLSLQINKAQEASGGSFSMVQTLGGWVQRGGKAKFLVADEEIVGVTVRGEPNSYLCTEKAYGDFELELEFRVEDNRLNSGVQVRSQSFPEFQKGIVHGHQIEIDPTDRGWTGAIYDEARDGGLPSAKPGEDSSKVFRLGQWNALSHRLSWYPDYDLVERSAGRRLSERKVGSGLHRSANAFNLEAQEMQIRFRKIRLLELSNDARPTN